jgi:hypothetical protein
LDDGYFPPCEANKGEFKRGFSLRPIIVVVLESESRGDDEDEHERNENPIPVSGSDRVF